MDSNKPISLPKERDTNRQTCIILAIFSSGFCELAALFVAGNRVTGVLTTGLSYRCRALDPVYYRQDESGKDLFCQKLRSELVDRILRIS